MPEALNNLSVEPFSCQSETLLREVSLPWKLVDSWAVQH